MKVVGKWQNEERENCTELKPLLSFTLKGLQCGRDELPRVTINMNPLSLPLRRCSLATGLCQRRQSGGMKLKLPRQKETTLIFANNLCWGKIQQVLTLALLFELSIKWSTFSHLVHEPALPANQKKIYIHFCSSSWKSTFDSTCCPTGGMKRNFTDSSWFIAATGWSHGKSLEAPSALC